MFIVLINYVHVILYVGSILNSLVLDAKYVKFKISIYSWNSYLSTGVTQK